MNRYPRLLVCEGFEDKLFFEALIEARDLPRFHVWAANGKDKIEEAISAYRIKPKSNYAGLSDILIVADNDDEPEARFQSIRKQVNSFFERPVAPSKPLEKGTVSHPSCTILMLPWAGVPGALETVVLQAARVPDAGVAAAVDQFLATVNADRWRSDLRKHKAWMRAILAARCSDPGVPFGDVFGESKYRDLIPLTDPSLNQIAEVLQSFEKKKS